MDQIKSILAKLGTRQKISILLAIGLVGAGLYAFTRWTRERDFKPLYSGMAAEDAGAVVQKLRESGVDFRLSENGTAVSVPSAKVAELRLQLAAAGLPKTGRAGFELFDKANFGATDFAEHINYRRALEGELERSVMALEEVESARVHVTFPKDSIFLESRQPAKASVMVRLKPGARLSPQNVTAICHLVSSAVEGLGPEAVSVLDMNGNLLSRRRLPAQDGDQVSEAALEYRQQIEKDLLAKINSTLEPLLGAEKFRAGVSVECDFTSGEQSEETFDPAKSVMTSSQKTEDAAGTASAAGVPGTASNLPRPASRPANGGGGFTRRTENITYQSSRTVRHVRTPQGALKRMSISILVDQAVRWEGTGPAAKRVFEPPAPEKLKIIRDLVAGATGLTPDRGDQIIVETLPFESTLRLEPPPAAQTAPPASPTPDWRRLLEDKNVLAVTGALAGLLILLSVAGVLLRRSRARKAAPEIAPSLPGAAPPGGEIEPAQPPIPVEKQIEAQLAENDSRKQQQEKEALAKLKGMAPSTKKAEVLTKYLTESATKDPGAAAQIIRTWLHDLEEVK